MPAAEYVLFFYPRRRSTDPSPVPLLSMLRSRELLQMGKAVSSSTSVLVRR